ncbi:MAG: hypothetical protein R3293_20690 [Candidatus Promineifilaceae bacterium]|nr:hypothetical protein [Candidatus Promineifilaceae bacterium]
MNKLQVNLGEIVVTPEAKHAMIEQGIHPAALIQKHIDGDWDNDVNSPSDMDDFEVWRMITAQKLAQGELWVITEFDRHVTTIALPDEY